MSSERSCPEADVFPGDLEAEARLLKALADPARLRILATLARADDDVCVCDFTSALGLNQSTVSHHLKLLRDADLVTSERRGTWAYYSLAPGARSPWRRFSKRCSRVPFAHRTPAGDCLAIH